MVAGTQDQFGYKTLAHNGFIHWGGGYNTTAVALIIKICQHLYHAITQL